MSTIRNIFNTETICSTWDTFTSYIVSGNHLDNLYMLSNKGIALSNKNDIIILLSLCVFLYVTPLKWVGKSIKYRLEQNKEQVSSLDASSLDASYHKTKLPNGINKKISCIGRLCKHIISRSKPGDLSNHRDLRNLDTVLNDIIAYKKKIKDVEDILIDGDYNDELYLAYDSDDWTMKKLKEKAISMGIPDMNWGSRSSIGNIIRMTEIVQKIDNIIKPTYPDGYDTDELDYQ